VEPLAALLRKHKFKSLSQAESFAVQINAISTRNSVEKGREENRKQLLGSLGVYAETPDDFMRDTGVVFNYNTPTSLMYWHDLPVTAAILANVPEFSFYRDYESARDWFVDKYGQRNNARTFRMLMHEIDTDGFFLCPICRQSNSRETTFSHNICRTTIYTFASAWFERLAWGRNYYWANPLCADCLFGVTGEGRDGYRFIDDEKAALYLSKEIKREIRHLRND
jgi:hypothetical protein